MDRHFATADLLDAAPETAVCELAMLRFGGRARFFGPIRTVRCREDNALVRRSLEEKSDGEVLVVDGGGSLRAALMGDMLGALAVQNGWAGVVIHGAVRDTVALRTLDLGVQALGSNPRKSRREGVGEAGVTLEFGGIRFTPGHWLYSDEDGIAVSPVDLLAELPVSPRE